MKILLLKLKLNNTIVASKLYSRSNYQNTDYMVKNLFTKTIYCKIRFQK